MRALLAKLKDRDFLFDILRNSLKTMFVKTRINCMFIYICKLYSLNLSLKYIDWLIDWLIQQLLQYLIYAHFQCGTNQRSSTEAKLKIMKLNLYLTLMSQATCCPKELQLECEHTLMIESSRTQMIYFAMKGLHRGLFNFILFYLVMIHL